MAKINGIHHINFVVKSLQARAPYFSKLLGCEPTYDKLHNRNVKTARFDLNGIWLVLVEPQCDDSEVGKFLNTRGEGLFLLSFAVDSIEDTALELSLRDINLDSKGKRNGLDNWQVCDLDAPEGLGAILQLCSPSP